MIVARSVCGSRAACRNVKTAHGGKGNWKPKADADDGLNRSRNGRISESRKQRSDAAPSNRLLATPLLDTETRRLRSFQKKLTGASRIHENLLAVGALPGLRWGS